MAELNINELNARAALQVNMEEQARIIQHIQRMNIEVFQNLTALAQTPGGLLDSVACGHLHEVISHLQQAGVAFDAMITAINEERLGGSQASP